jgi:hypothetical protein
MNLGIARAACAALVLVLVAGCASGPQRTTAELRRQAFPPRVVVMPVDVELSSLSAGGMTEPNAEWTEAATRNIATALSEEAKVRNLVFVPYAGDRGTAADQEITTDLIRLHRAVGETMFIQASLPALALPTKQGRFDWGLGPDVAAIAKSQDADYALFIHVRDSYASAGRVAVMVVGAVLGVGISGGVQVGFASIADLRTGDIVWFNRLLRGYGDLRTPEGARETVKALLTDAPQ